MITITKKFNFCYGHHLPDYKGKCARKHGHNADLEVTVKGPPLGEFLHWWENKDYSGMVVDFGILKAIVRQEVLETLDHQYLNDVIGKYPTAENIALWIWITLKKAFGKNLVKITLSEGPDSYVTIKDSEVLGVQIHKFKEMLNEAS